MTTWRGGNNYTSSLVPGVSSACIKTALRYYGNALLDSIHRSIAVEEWHRLRLDRDSLEAQVAGVRLERALGAFDLFVLHDQFGDLDDVRFTPPIGAGLFETKTLTPLRVDFSNA